MINLKRVVLRFATGFSAALLVVEGASVIQGLLAAKHHHVATFTAAPEAQLLFRHSHTVLTGRVLASGPEFADTIDIVTSGDWLLALRLNNRLIGLNLRNGSVRDFSAVLANQPRIEYHQMWPGRRQGEVFLGNISRTFTQVSVTPEGIGNGARSFDRATDVRYSLPLAEERWLSNGYFRDDTTLVVGQLVADHLTDGHAVKRPVFPGIAPFVSLEANKNSIAASPDGDRLAQVFWFAPLIYIYDSTGALLHSIAAPVSVMQAFDEHLVHGDVRMRYLPETTRCYIAVVAASKRVIALFSGKTIRQSGTVQGSQLHIFTWDGQLIELVNLDSLVSSLAGSSEGSRLWAARRGTHPAIVEYTLPEPGQ